MKGISIVWLTGVAFFLSSHAVGQGNGLNESNLRLLIKDSIVYGNALYKGLYAHPAIEIARFKQPELLPVQNYPIRISLDPGHLATNRKEAILEERYIHSKAGFYYEAELTMATALVLQRLLQERGFEVMLTRQEKESSLGPSFLAWYRKEFKKQAAMDLQAGRITQTFYNELQGASKKEVFHRYFKDVEFRSRAQKINSFNPDIALSIHYNASEFRNDTQSYAPLSDTNYSVVFVGGGFTLAELALDSQMEDFIRMASSNVLPASIRLASYLAEEFETKLKAPRLQPDAPIPYLHRYSVYTQVPGVYSRNLYLTRAVKAPIVYGECFVQNSIQENDALALRTFKVGSIRTSPRVQAVAEAYYSAIIKYFQAIHKLP